MKNSIKVIMTFFSLTVLLVGCNSFTEKQTEEKAQKEVMPPMEMEPVTAAVEKSTTDYRVGDKLPNDLVCMVNDAYMAKPQIPVPVNGKTYYGCCEMCVGTLNNEESARMATDPQTGERVDKTEAFIVLLDANGRVGYFNSEANYTAYAKKS